MYERIKWMSPPEQLGANRLENATLARERIIGSRYGRISGITKNDFNHLEPSKISQPEAEITQSRQILLRALKYSPRLALQVLRDTTLEGVYLAKGRDGMLASSGIDLSPELSKDPILVKRHKNSLRGSLGAGYRYHWKELLEHVDENGKIRDSIAESKVSYLRRLVGMELTAKMKEKMKEMKAEMKEKLLLPQITRFQQDAA